MVTINYRLGALGFLSLPNAKLTGNYGLLDQQMAMKWIKKYIQHFGGNPDNVTLMGWSAGAASATFHMYAKSSKGLFHKAILMSGTLLNPWALNTNSIKCTMNLLRKLKIPLNMVDDPMHLMEYLQKQNAKSFVTLESFIYFGIVEYCFVPVIDGDFIELPPEELILKPPYSTVPMLLGSTSSETNLNFPYDFYVVNDNLPNKNSTFIIFRVYDYLENYLSSSGDLEERKLFLRKFRCMIEMCYGIHQFLKHYTIWQTNEKAFVYRFSFDGKFGNFKHKKQREYNPPAVGAVHGDDLGYLFKDFLVHSGTGNKKISSFNYNGIELEPEVLVRNRLVLMWSNFIKFGCVFFFLFFINN